MNWAADILTPTRVAPRGWFGELHITPDPAYTVGWWIIPSAVARSEGSGAGTAELIAALRAEAHGAGSGAGIVIAATTAAALGVGQGTASLIAEVLAEAEASGAGAATAVQHYYVTADGHGYRAGARRRCCRPPRLRWAPAWARPRSS
ncbi:hypothetical protein [Mycolicibacterium insubricum]|uniref:hypothetical protein n=1 Tax=Mycolicibacterium insubricum TaxID=444597 RepID=UPI0021F3C648|nr:hypothetical protein [Mycolicibacterium insubricum]MCV7081286.1 hypothetical protein [Mycolicibacterium insubricum]